MHYTHVSGEEVNNTGVADRCTLGFNRACTCSARSSRAAIPALRPLPRHACQAHCLEFLGGKISVSWCSKSCVLGAAECPGTLVILWGAVCNAAHADFTSARFSDLACMSGPQIEDGSRVNVTLCLALVYNGACKRQNKATNPILLALTFLGP